jgi:hypothetical protein
MLKLTGQNGTVLVNPNTTSFIISNNIGSTIYSIDGKIHLMVKETPEQIWEQIHKNSSKNT